MKVLDFLKMPEYDNTFDKSFEQVCDERAQFLLHYAEWKNKKIAVMYSGGVDSTLILCSFLKNAKPNQLKNISIVECFGDGSPKREFLYSDDLADASIFLMNTEVDSFINIGTGIETSIMEIVELICEIAIIILRPQVRVCCQLRPT